MGRARATNRKFLPPPWQGIRLRRASIGADPDAPEIPVTLPSAWDDQAASALAALASPNKQADLIASASAWIDPVAASLGDPSIAQKLHLLLRERRGAPSIGVWRLEPEPKPGFTLNLPGFFSAETGFDHAAFGEAADVAVAALTAAAPQADTLMIGIADLALLLAQMGLDYDSDQARQTGVDLAAFLTARATLASQGRHRCLSGILPAGPVEALLGVETTGIAAPVAALDGQLQLARWARALLAARGASLEGANLEGASLEVASLEQALAAAISGGDPFAVPSPAAARAMHAAVAPQFHTAPERASIALSVRAPNLRGPASREPLPARRAGYTQKASIGGHRVFVRTGEHADGRLGDLAIAIPRENAAFRGLMDAFASAVSIGLQHGAPLEAFIEAFTLTRFGPAGAVEGDPAVSRATSLIDYVFRHLAANYPNDLELPPAAPELEERLAQADLLPFLPMELPRNPPAPAPPRRPILKLVG